MVLYMYAGWGVATVRVSLCCRVCHCGSGRCGGAGVAGTLEVMEDVEGLGELLDGTFGCLLKLLWL